MLLSQLSLSHSSNMLGIQLGGLGSHPISSPSLHVEKGEHFVVQSHTYPAFMGKVSSLTHFMLESGCEDYSFLDQAVADFEQGLDSTITNSVKTLELDASFEESCGVPSSVSSGFLYMVSTISDASKLQLAPSIKSHKLWCRLEHYFCLCLWQTRCQHLN